MLEAAIEAGAEDVKSDADGHVITCAFEDLGDVARKLEAALGEAETVKAVWLPQTATELDDDKAASMMKLLDAARRGRRRAERLFELRNLRRWRWSG